MKKLTLGLCIVTTTSAALAHDIEYKVCKGDTLATIAKKFHVSGRSILHANDLTPDHHMRPGHFLLIPGVDGAVAHRAGQKVGRIPTYVIRNGDQDWSLAMKHGISVHKLHLANPGIDWDHLHIGARINFPYTGVVAKTHSSQPHLVASNHGAHKHETAHLASFSHGVHMKAHWHVVEPGENDWVIAHKAGIRLKLLVALNPEHDLSTIRVGQKIRVPGSSVMRLAALHVPRIHSTHVVINGDNVTIRREQGVGAESICTVDAGTTARVLDRDGNWYQLKFPKGTVGWVRGDLLKPVHEIEEVVEAPRRHHHAIVEVDHEEVAVHHHHSAPQVSHSHHDYVAKVSRHHSLSHSVEHSERSSYTALDKVAGGDDDAASVIRAGRSMLGTRYVWGAASRSGTDCSGFTMQAFRAKGIHLPRVSRDQAQLGTKVARNDVEPGDLLFFHTYGRGHRITHVAISEGGNKFLHASSGRHAHRVTESSLNEPYYRNHLVVIKRLLKGHHHHSTEVASSSSPVSKKIRAAQSEKPAETMAEAEKRLHTPDAQKSATETKSSL